MPNLSWTTVFISFMTVAIAIAAVVLMIIATIPLIAGLMSELSKHAAGDNSCEPLGRSAGAFDVSARSSVDGL